MKKLSFFKHLGIIFYVLFSSAILSSPCLTNEKSLPLFCFSLIYAMSNTNNKADLIELIIQLASTETLSLKYRRRRKKKKKKKKNARIFLPFFVFAAWYLILETVSLFVVAVVVLSAVAKSYGLGFFGFLKKKQKEKTEKCFASQSTNEASFFSFFFLMLCSADWLTGLTGLINAF